MTLCECGCGREVKEGNKFINGHNGRNLSEEAKAKISEANKGRKLSAATKRKMSAAKKGHKYGLGHKHTDETKKKIGSAQKGRNLSDEIKHKIGESNKGRNLGRKQSKETKRKIRESTKGENGNNWQGGVSFEPYCPKFNESFKESIRDKFGRKCFLCGEKENGRKLGVHHVNYDKSCLCADIKCEFVPLCTSCHGKTSRGDREYWEETIIAKLEALVT